MRPTSPSPTEWLALGDPRLLHEPGPAPATGLVALAQLEPTAPSPPDNTAILTWRGLRPVRLSAHALDGNHSTRPLHPADDLLPDGLPSSELREAMATLADQTGLPAPSNCTPLFYVTATPTDGALEVHAYSRTRFHPDDACFLRITPAPLRAWTIYDLSWLHAALGLHTLQRQFLNSHECHYRRCFDGQELEYKYTLAPSTDIWALAAETHRRLQEGDIPGFIPKYRDSFETWDFPVYLHEITGPKDEDRGYISFTPTVDGKHLIKRKWFTQDTFTRREELLPPTALDGTHHDYIARNLGVETHPLPPFRRVRYNIKLESPHTGHVYTILFDRCTVDDSSDVLCQCEIEYLKTRTAIYADENTVISELEIVAQWVDQLLTEAGFTPHRDNYSKLSFLHRIRNRRS